MFLRFEKMIRYAAWAAAFIAGILFAHAVFGQSRYVVPCPPAVASASLDSLERFVGVREATGHNDGPEVDVFLSHVYLPDGNPWCAAVQVTAIDTARGAEPLPILRSGLANAIFNDAKRRGKRMPFIPRVGDLDVWQHPGTMSGHIARNVKVNPPWMLTIEGNTSNGASGSQREGNGCFMRLRKIGDLGGMKLRGCIGLGQ